MRGAKKVRRTNKQFCLNYFKGHPGAWDVLYPLINDGALDPDSEQGEGRSIFQDGPMHSGVTCYGKVPNEILRDKHVGLRAISGCTQELVMKIFNKGKGNLKKLYQCDACVALKMKCVEKDSNLRFRNNMKERARRTVNRGKRAIQYAKEHDGTIVWPDAGIYTEGSDALHVKEASSGTEASLAGTNLQLDPGDWIFEENWDGKNAYLRHRDLGTRQPILPLFTKGKARGAPCRSHAIPGTTVQNEVLRSTLLLNLSSLS